MTPFRGLQELRILLVEDNPGDVELVREYFDEAEMGTPDLEVVGTLSGAAEILESDRGDAPDAVLLDLNLPDSGGLDTLHAVLGSAPKVPVLVLTGLAESEMGVEAVRRGAQDFLPKDRLTPVVLGRAVRYGIERKRAMDQLRRSRDRFRTIFRAGPYGFLVTSDGIIEDANPQAARIFGYGRGALVDRELADLIPDGLNEAVRALRRGSGNASAAPTPGSDLELRGRRKDGSEFPVEVSLSSFRESGRLRVLVVVQDVTERRRMEEEREGLIRDLRDALDEVRTLRGILPICSSCKSIRDDAGYWHQVDSYIRSYSEVEFTHSLCPDCSNNLYGDIPDPGSGKVKDGGSGRVEEDEASHRGKSLRTSDGSEQMDS